MRVLIGTLYCLLRWYKLGRRLQDRYTIYKTVWSSSGADPPSGVLRGAGGLRGKGLGMLGVCWEKGWGLVEEGLDSGGGGACWRKGWRLLCVWVFIVNVGLVGVIQDVLQRLQSFSVLVAGC